MKRASPKRNLRDALRQKLFEKKVMRMKTANCVTEVEEALKNFNNARMRYCFHPSEKTQNALREATNQYKRAKNRAIARIRTILRRRGPCSDETTSELVQIRYVLHKCPNAPQMEISAEEKVFSNARSNASKILKRIKERRGTREDIKASYLKLVVRRIEESEYKRAIDWLHNPDAVPAQIQRQLSEM